MSTATLHIEKRTALVPKLRFQEFEGEWQRKTLFDISKDVSYGMNAAAKSFDGIHKYLRITDIDSDSRMFKPNPLTSPEGHIDEKFKLKENDLLFTRTGASVGKSYLYNSKDGALYYAGFLIKFSIVNANSYFVYSLTLKESYDKWVHVYSMRSGQPGLNAEEYKAFKISIPTLPEQQKIASFLSAVDEKIQQLSRKKELLEQYKKGVMQQLFSGKLRFKDENGEDYPDWEEKKLGEIAEKRIIKNKDNKINLVFTNSAMQGIVNQRDFFDKDIANQNNLLGYYIVENNDFVYNPRISTNAPVGPISRNYLDTGIMSPLYSVFRFKVGNLDFIEYFFNSTVWHMHMKDISNYGARDDRMSFSTSDFYKMPIPFPYLEEQQKIASFLSSIDVKIESTNQQITQTQMFKKGLLQKMFV